MPVIVDLPKASDRVVQGTAGTMRVLFHLDDRRLHVLNETAGAVWDALSRRETAAETSARLADLFGADPSVVRRDVVELVDRLRSDGLIVADEGPAVAQQHDAAPRLEPAPGRPSWPTNGSYRALDARVTIETPDRELGDVIAAALAPLASAVPPEYAIRADPHDGGRWRVATREDEPKIVADRRAAVVRVLGEVNAAAVESAPHQLVLHAAAVAAADGVVVLPAGPNHGKSTLTVALMRSGFAYLTDEAAAITRDGLCRPYPKPISLDPGSFAVHRDLAPSPRDGLAGELDNSAWHVSPDRIGAVGEAAPVITIVLPRWQPESKTLLTALPPNEALTALVGEAFDFGVGGQQVFDILCDLVAGTQVWRLQYSDGHEAVSVIEHILATSKFLGK